MEEKDKKEEKYKTDTIGGMLETMIPLVILPSILPLLQQSLSQTLSSTTVNVKIESSVAMLPVSIEASTVIMPVEIKASTVTLNVNITAAEAVVKINISAQSVDVKLTETYYTLEGYEKKFLISITDLVPWGDIVYGELLFSYTVPSNKRLVIYGISALILGADASVSIRYSNWGSKSIFTGDDLLIGIWKDGNPIFNLILDKEQKYVYVELPTPLLFNSGEKINLYGSSMAYTTRAMVMIYGVEIPA